LELLAFEEDLSVTFQGADSKARCMSIGAELEPTVTKELDTRLTALCIARK
jgi:hypothetical protein